MEGKAYLRDSMHLSPQQVFLGKLYFVSNIIYFEDSVDLSPK
jgi:hypothetical protein